MNILKAISAFVMLAAHACACGALWLIHHVDRRAKERSAA